MEIPSPYYRLSVKAKIKIDGKILLVREDGKDWDLPGGGVEHNETIEDALRRELMEETGITDFKIKKTPEIFKMIDKSANRPLLFLAFEVEAETLGAPTTDTEIRLFTKSDLPNDIVSYSKEYTGFIRE